MPKFWLTLLVMSLLATPALRAADPIPWVYFGTYTGGKSQGIYVSRFDPATGALSEPTLAAEATHPSFLAFHPKADFLYSVGEVEKVKDQTGGVVVAFAIDRATGRLRRLNEHSSKGASPCHLVVDATGKWVLVANYTGGNVAVLPIEGDGSLGSAVGTQQHSGSSVNKARQEKPHAHSINLDPANRFAVVADLGIDELKVYRFGAWAGALQSSSSVKLPPGSGPRHFAFHPGGQHAFCLNELLSTLTAFRYRPDDGKLTEPVTLPTLPDDFKGENTTAEVVVHPNGRWVYASNRGHNSIALFRYDPAEHRLTPAGHTPTQGRTPRNFSLDPSGRWLLAANQDSDSVVVFSVDADTGALKPHGTTITVGKPVCVRFLPAR